MFRFLSALYGIISTVFFVLFYPFIALFRLHTGKDTGTRKIKLGLFKKPNLGGIVIMFHAVSVGEVISLDKLIKKTREKFPDCKIVLTTGTKTGQELAKKKYAEAADFITYFPFDIPFSVKNFLNKINPAIVFIAETELWPEFAIQCKKRKIPIFIINGRISDSSLNSYTRLKFFFSPILKLYTKIYAQSDLDRTRFVAAGACKKDTEVMKNLKFDIDKPVFDISANYRIFTAGSTHSGENEIIIKVYDYLKKRHKDLKLVIAPRHLERVPEIAKILDNYKYKTGYRSMQASFTDNDIIILDTYGELQKTYIISYIAFIGGSFSNTGGHNPLEAAICFVPTVTGPSVKNFRDIYAILTAENASKIVNNEQELADYIDKLLSNKKLYADTVKACERVFESRKGAADFITDKIELYLNKKRL